MNLCWLSFWLSFYAFFFPWFFFIFFLATFHCFTDGFRNVRQTLSRCTARGINIRTSLASVRAQENWRVSIHEEKRQNNFLYFGKYCSIDCKKDRKIKSRRFLQGVILLERFNPELLEWRIKINFFKYFRA